MSIGFCNCEVGNLKPIFENILLLTYIFQRIVLQSKSEFKLQTDQIYVCQFIVLTKTIIHK
jgi:hypothetical protein